MASFIQNALLLMMLLVLFQMNECDAALLKRRYVNVTNDLPGGSTLTLHCKSRDDDLGERVLPPQASWEFNFRPAWISDTQYYCSFDWPGEPTKWFDIYVHDRDKRYCSKCWWSVRPAGPCRWNWDENQYQCYPWNKE